MEDNTNQREISEQKINPADHLANERTFLAWIRTGIAVMAFGFVVTKFSLFVRQFAIVFDEKLTAPAKEYTNIIGVVLVLLGAIMTLLAYVRYRNIQKHLLNNTYYPSLLLSLILTACMLIISVLLIFYFLTGF